MAKLNVLVVAYYFPPAKAVAGLRVYSWCKYFPADNFEPVFFTRKWSGAENSWTDLTKNVGGEPEEELLYGNTVFRLPSRSILDQSWIKNVLLRFKFTERLVRFILNLLGHFNVETDARLSFKKNILSYVQSNPVDLIVVSSPPLNLVRLAHELNQETGIPYHVDFRDLWSNEYLKSGYHPSASVAFIDRLKMSYLKKWLKNAEGVTIDSQAKADVLKTVCEHPISIVTNGYDEEYYSNAAQVKNKKFTLTLSGTFYPQQPLTIFLDGIQKFLIDKKPEHFQVQLIGLEVHSAATEKIKAVIPAPFLLSINRVTAKENATMLAQSHVTFLAAWEGYKGLYTTKLFDMIASGTMVLIAPGDKDVMDHTVITTKTGLVVNDANSFASILNKWYAEWETTGALKMEVNSQEIEKFSRKYCANRLASILLDNFSTNNSKIKIA